MWITDVFFRTHVLFCISFMKCAKPPLFTCNLRHILRSRLQLLCWRRRHRAVLNMCVAYAQCTFATQLCCRI